MFSIDWKARRDAWDEEFKVNQQVWRNLDKKRDWLIATHPPGHQFEAIGLLCTVVFHSTDYLNYSVNMRVKYLNKAGEIREHTFSSDEFPLREWLEEMPPLTD